jgi:small subunit ribosomal protein S16
MAVKIRLSRVGKKSAPFYRIVAIDERKKRDGAFLEDLGTYDAIGNKIVRLNHEGIDSWVAKGAVETDAVKKIRKLNKKAAEPAAPAPKAKAKTTKKTEAEA